jgi:ribosomal protein L25 (general stress protein Ctc)
LVPGVLYGVDEDNNVVKTMIHVKLRALEKEIRERKTSLECTVFKLKLDDNTEHIVTPRQLQIHPCMYIHLYMYMFIHIYMYIYVYVYMYI